MEDRRKVLYDRLHKEYDLGDFESFSEGLNDENVRKNFYDVVSERYDIGDYDTFVSEITPKDTAANQVNEPYTHEYDENMNLVGGTAYKEPEPYQYKPEVQQHILQNKPEMFKSNKGSLLDKPLKLSEEQPEPMYQPQSIVNTLNDAYGAANDYAERVNARAEIAERNLKDPIVQKGRTEADMRGLLTEIDGLLEKEHGRLKSKTPVGRNAFNALMGSTQYNQSNKGTRKNVSNLDAAKRLLEQSQYIVDAAKRGDTGILNDTWQGFKDSLEAEDFTFGLADAASSAAILDAIKKVENGEELTESEDKLLRASAINMAVQYNFANDLGRAYKMGQVTAESVPFMLEMAINPISSFGKASAKTLLNYGLKSFAKQVGKGLAKGAAAGAGMAITTGLGGVAAGTTDRLAGNYNYGVDFDGKLYAEKKRDTMGVGEAAVRSFATRAIENQSEMIFRAFDGLGDFMKGVNVSLPGGVNKFFNLLKNNKAADAYRAIKNSKVFRNYLVKDFRNATQIGGFVEEAAEEVYNNLANFAIGEMSWDKLTDLDNNIDMLLGLAPTQVMFGLLGLGGAGAMRYQTRRTLEDLQATMNEQQRKELEGLLDMGLDAREVDVRGFIRNVMQNENYTIDNKRDLIKAAFYVAKQNGIDELTQADVVDKVNAENSLIDSVTDPSTGMYSELTAILSDGNGGQAEMSGYIVGWLGEGDKAQPIFVPEGMENTYENRRVLKPGQWKPEDVQQMPAEEVKALNEEMIREEAAVQAENEARWNPNVPEPQEGLSFFNGEEEVTIVGMDGNGGLFVAPGDEYRAAQGNEKKMAEVVNRAMQLGAVPVEQYKDAMTVQLEADEKAPNVKEPVINGQAVVHDGDTYQVLGVDSDGVQVQNSKGITKVPLNIWKSWVYDYQQANKPSEVTPSESVGEQVNAGVNTEVNNSTTSVVQSESAPRGDVEGNTAQETAESGAGIETTQPTLEQVVASLPKTNKGEIDYKAMTPQQQFQYTSLSESPEVALEDLQADIAANEEEIAKVQEQLAKARGGQRAELRDKVRNLTSVNKELKAFYESVAPKQGIPAAETESIEPVNNEAQEAVEEAKPIVVETEKPKKAKKPKLVGKKKKKDSEFTDEELLPTNGVELAAEQFAAGNVKITIDSYKKETGHGEEERKKMGLTPFRGVDKGGLTIEQAAEKLVEEDNANHNGRIFDGDTMAARDAIIELFGSTEKWGDVTGYIKNNRIAERKKREEAEYAEYEAYLMESLHVTPEELELLNEAEEQRIYELSKVIDEVDVIFAEAELERQNNEVYEQGRIIEGNQGQSELLSEKRVGDLGGNQRDESQRGTSEVGGTSEYNSQAPQESASGSEVAPSIEATNVGRMADIEARILEIEGRRNEISDEIAEMPDYDTLAIAELRAEEWELDQEQAELEAEYSGLSSMNDESRAIIEAEGGEVLFRSKGKRTGTPKDDFVKRAEEWSEKTGVKVRFANRLSDVSNREARQQLLRGEKITGWYEKSTGEVVLYLPNLSSMEEVDATYIHEVVAHKGMSGLLGDRFNEFLDSVWDMMSLADKRKYWSYPGVSSEKNEEGRRRAAADEYIANTFESIDVTESAWSKLTDLIKRFLKAIGIEPKMTNADIANTIKKSYQRLLSGEGVEGNVSGEGARFSAKKKASKTVLPEDESSFKGSVVSDADRAKVLNNLDILQKEYEEKSSKRRKTFISDLSKALLLRNNGNNSNYADYVSVNGEEVTIRISDHNVSVKDMDNAGKSNGISIVIGRKPNEGIRDFGDSHIVEYYYNNKKLENSESNPYTEIIQSFKQTVYSGEYKDTTGLAERQEVNPTLFRVTKDKNELVAVHNISEDNLRKVLSVGGLIMPSIAITKADMGHEGYGEISLLFDKETINPSDRRNKVYGGDAWTPRFPQMTPKLNDKVLSKVRNKIRGLIEDRTLSELYSLSAELHPDNIERTISNRGIEGYYNEEWMKLAYLLDNGKKVKTPMKMKDYGDMSETIIEMAKERGLKVSDIQQSGFDFYQNNSDFVDAVKKVVDEKKLSSLPEEKREALRKLLGEKEMKFNYFDTLISAAARMEYDLEHGGLKQIIDRSALSETIKKKVKTDNADYNKWVDSLFDGIVEKYGIRNDRDWYTPSGNLRPWGQLYDEATPANILKHMLAENEQGGSGGFFDSNIMGASAETYDSIEEIREKGKKRLRRLEDGEYEEWSNSVAERMSEICYGFLSAKQRDEFGASIDAKIAITNAVAKDKTAKGIYKEMKREYPGFTMEHAKKVEEIVKEIQDFAIGYFEAKPRRIVPLREVRKAIVPKKTSEDILEGLKNNGIEVATYKRGDEAARARLIKRESNGIRFRRVYHGSGASFDKFDHSFMGTGEGAQAFGWGTYVTDEEGIGKRYAKQMGSEPMLYYKGMPDREAYRKHPELQYLAFFMDSGSSAEEAIEKRKNILSRIVNDESSYWLRKEEAQRVIEWLDSVNPEDIEFRRNRHLYEVEIPDNDGTNYLVWDKPLSEEQAKRIKDAVLDSKMFKDYATNYGEEISRERLDSWLKAFDTGRVYRLLENFADLRDGRESAKAISMLLNEAGFVGFEYPANYYSGGNEDGSKNYVIFNEHDLDIVEHTRFRVTKEKMDALNKEVADFTSEYKSKPVSIVEIGMDDKALMEAFGNKPKLEDLKSFMERSKTSAAYIQGLDKIVIFADNASPSKMKLHLFHENIHGVLFNENHSKLIAEFYEYGKDKAELVKWIEALNNEEYEKYSVPEEFLAYVVSDGMVKDDLENVFGFLSDRMKKDLNGVLKKIGYDYDNRRRNVGQASRPETEGKSGVEDDADAEGKAGGNREGTGKGKSGKISQREQAERLGKLFGQVADMGLDGVLGNGHYDKAMMDIYRELPEDARRIVSDDALGRPKVDFIGAMSDYLNNAEISIWDKVTGIIRDALRKVGFDVELNTNDVKYILWRNRKPLDRNNLVEVAEDIDMRYRLKVGEYNGSPTRFRAIDRVNEKFNEELSALNEENADKVELNLGSPSAILRAAGVEDKPMKLYGNKVIKKMKKHGFNLDELRDLPNAVADPIAVFENYGEVGNRSILTELKTEQGNFLVTLSLGKGHDIDFNIVTSVFGKGESNIVDWIEKGYGVYYNKKKTLDYLHHSALKAVTSDNQGIDSATKIVESFENPKIEGENVRFRAKKKAELIDLADERPAIIKEYDKELKTSGFNFQEAFQDRMLSVKVLMEKIEAASGKKARKFEDAYEAENQLSSKNKVEQERWLDQFYKPLLEELQRLSDKHGFETVRRYIYCKSGLERNEVLRQRDADAAYNEAKEELDDKLAKGDITQAQYDALLDKAEDQRNKTLSEDIDYSGLRGMLFNVRADELFKQYKEGNITEQEYNQKIEDLKNDKANVIKDWKDFAEVSVSDFESRAPSSEIDALWSKVNAATDETLRIDFESGMIDRETYEAEKKMMKYYVPLRNWANTTAEDMYEYRHDMTPAVTSNQKTAKGRESEADNPIATIALMAQNAIVRGNRNKMKMAFYSFVVNRPTALASVRNVWYVRDANNQWQPQYADTSAASSEAEMKQIIEQFEDNMKQLEEQGDAFRGKQKIGMNFRASGKQRDEHVVAVMINGKEYAVYVNGNPRAAQAVNGLTNNEAVDDAAKWIDALKRYYGAGLTSWNPDFIIPNLVRDTIHATTMTFLDKGVMASVKYAANVPRIFNHVAKEVSGISTGDPKLHQYFEEFVVNGGETGYTAIHTLEDYKKEYDKLMNEAKGLKGTIGKNTKEVIRKISKVLEAANRIAEDVNRFNAYVTSRESGAGVVESVSAAKNITVNFNRKGALNANHTVYGKVASWMSRWILFFNPSVQGIYQLVTKTKENPKRATALGASILASGFIVPMINDILVSMFGDDEDDYWNQSDYKRRNNWMLFVGDGYISIPLPPVLRELYGIGDIMYGVITGHIPAQRAVYDMLKQVQSAVGFVNVIPEVSQEPDMITYVKGFAPDIVAPFMDVISNSNFMGRPIAKWTDYNESDPEYERVYKGVGKHWVELSKFMNELGGNETRRSANWGNFINPAMMEHLFTSYTGGIGKTINNLAGMIIDAANGDTENMDVFRKTPVLHRFYTPNDEKTVVPGINRKFYEFNYQYNNAKRSLKKNEDGVKSGEHPEWQKYIDEMKENGEYEFIQYFERENKKLKKIQNLLKGNPTNKKELEQKEIDKKAEIATESLKILRGEK